MLERVWLGPTARTLTERFGEPECGVARLAARLLSRARLTSPPFYPDSLAPFCSVKKILSRQIPRNGMLARAAGGFTILIDSKFRPRSAQWNAICAHELGHVLLAQICERSLDPGNEWIDEDEYLADRAARELILPAQEFRRVARANLGQSAGLALNGVNEIAPVTCTLLATLMEVFRTPVRMTARRMIETAVWSDLLIIWRKNAGDLVLESSLPEQHPAARLLKRHTTANQLFGPGNSIHKSLRHERETERLETVAARKALYWFVRSALFPESDSRYVVSFVVTSETQDAASR